MLVFVKMTWLKALVSKTVAICETADSRPYVLESPTFPGRDDYKTFGKALARVRDKRLYKRYCKTFEEYCRTKFGLSRVRAHQLIKASEVADHLEEHGYILPCERHARELSRVTPVQQLQIWEKLLSQNKNVSAASIRSEMNGDKGLNAEDRVMPNPPILDEKRKRAARRIALHSREPFTAIASFLGVPYGTLYRFISADPQYLRLSKLRNEVIYGLVGKLIDGEFDIAEIEVQGVKHSVFFDHSSSHDLDEQVLKLKNLYREGHRPSNVFRADLPEEYLFMDEHLLG